MLQGRLKVDKRKQRNLKRYKTKLRQLAQGKAVKSVVLAKKGKGIPAKEVKRKEPYNPVEPEELSETPQLVIPKYDREPSHEPEVIEEQVSSYDEIIEKLKSVGAIDEQGNIYKKNGTTKRGNAFELVSYALNKGSKLKKRDVGIYTLAQWIKELGFDPQLFNNHFKGLLNSPKVTRSTALATNSSTPSTPKASRTPFRTPTGWINF